MLLRAESPRDYADLLLSWQHMPNVAIYDFARGLAKHMNLRAPDCIPFSPHEGRLLDPTPANIQEAKEGRIQVSLPWLTEKKSPPDDHSHPRTGSSQHYALTDTFHEKNSRDPKDVLRRVGLVPQLAGRVNTQVVEQFFAQMRKTNYFLNMAEPSTNIFLLRNILHHRNVKMNNSTIKKIQRTFGKDVQLNTDGLAVLGTLCILLFLSYLHFAVLRTLQHL